MESLDRKDNRLVSSLIDLKLDNIKNQAPLEDGKRKTRKLGALRAIYDNQIYQNFMEIIQKKNTNDKALILKSLRTHFTFSTLIEDKEIKDLLLQKFKLCKVDQGQYLIKQNSMASSFFILHEGKLVVEINGIAKRCIEPGEGFGELALLYSAPRSASIKALKPSFLWFIDRQTFRNAVSSMITKSFKENRSFIENNCFFKYLTPNQKDKLASVAINLKFQKNSQICKQGELASSMYILKSGKLGRYKGHDLQGAIIKGQSFQQYASLTKGCLRRETIRVMLDSQVMALGIEDIQNALGKSLPIIILRNEARNTLTSSKLFEKLSQEYIDKMIDCFKLRNVKTGEILVRKDDLCRNLIFFVAEGEYLISNNFKKMHIYGENALINISDVYKFDIKMKENGKIVWATQSEIIDSMGCSLLEAIDNSASIFKLMETQKNNRSNLNQMVKNLKLQEFQVLKKLGEGQFGNVFLVTDQKNNFYALKCISKQQAIKTKLQKHLQNQKQALAALSSPFIMEYIRSYKDENYIYFLTEFINGMQLFDTIRIIGLLSAEQTIFYGAQLLHIIQTIHNKSFIYRDLKPENVMVCSDGYLKLIDLGTCKKINGTEKTFTMIGTPNYMAPETLSGKGYSFSVDLWSLGIVLYEFMAGFVPFGQDADDPLQIYQQILKNPLKFPKHMKDSHINSLISVLLNKNADFRLGGGSFSSLKKHAAFSKIDWYELIKKKMKPCFEVSEDKLINFQKLKPKAKHIKSVLKIPNKISINRRDLAPNWDDQF